MVTRAMVRDWLLAYLNREIDRAALVGWARQVKREGAVFAPDADAVGPVLARIGLTGVAGYDLAWDDCFDLLEALGYAPQVIATPVADDSELIEGDDEGAGVSG